MTERLNVFLRGEQAGTLDYDETTQSMTFAYAPSFLSKENAMALSMALPLRTEAFDAYVTRVFFENLLPPEVVRRKLEKILHHDYRNVFAFLKALGGDCAGAISLFPDGDEGRREKDCERVLTNDEAREVLDSLDERPLLQGAMDGYRISLAGAQAKLVARIRAGAVRLPLYGSPSTHIIKPAMRACAESVANEYFCQKLAERIGIPAAKSDILSLGESRYYVTERYDRCIEENRIVRYLQEDFCQAMGIAAEEKYQDDGGPSIARCFRFLRDNAFGFAELEHFIDLGIYNFLIGNADAHGKNFSVLYGRSGRTLAPAYDEMSTAVYPNIANRMAMSIGGEFEFPRVTRKSFEALAVKCDINPKLMLSRIDELLEKITIAPALAVELSDAGNPSSIYSSICAIIARHSSQLRVQK